MLTYAALVFDLGHPRVHTITRSPLCSLPHWQCGILWRRTQYDLPENYLLLRLLVKQWFYYYYLFVVGDRWQRRSLLSWARCDIGRDISHWMVKIFSSNAIQQTSLLLYRPGSYTQLLTYVQSCCQFFFFCCLWEEGQRILKKKISLNSRTSSWHLWLSSSWNYASKLNVSKPPTQVSVVMSTSQRRVLSAQKPRAHVAGMPEWDAKPCLWTLWTPLSVAASPSPSLTVTSRRKDENSRVCLLPYFWKLQSCSQSGSDDLCLSAKHT